MELFPHQSGLFSQKGNMGNLKPKELSKLGFTSDKARSLIVNIMSKHMKRQTNAEISEVLAQLLANPEDFSTHEYLAPLAELYIEREEVCNFQSHSLLQETGRLKIYGGKEIEQGARKQMEVAMSLPVSKQGALMPDAHSGFGMPIGGVLATENAVIPYAVGVDIGCRMALTIFDETDNFIHRNGHQIKEALKNFTHFGMEGGLDFAQEHEILDRPEFLQTDLLRKLHGKAARQLGSSGSGNHFVEFGELELEENTLGLKAGKYTALLSHSGSRGLGANIAQEYIRIAMDVCRLPNEAKSLAWLGLDTEAGQEYWMSMSLAGDYAKACHDRIHINLAKALGIKPLTKIENHHNFAWKDNIPGLGEVVVHRKGATPAHEGELGIIPGSMTTAAYLVRGKGVVESLYSASHGAGRAMSRQKAKQSMTNSALKKILSDARVTLIGGSVEENPSAYKDIETVMAAQSDLVDVMGRFLPKVVRMNRE